MWDEEQITMSDPIELMEGVGPVTAQVFRDAGFFTIRDLYAFDCQDVKLVDACEETRQLKGFPNAYAKAMMTRCINIIYRARSANASPYIPEHFACPISLDWLVKPVITPSGITYSRGELEEWLKHNPTDPVSRSALRITDAVPNLALETAVHYHRKNHLKFNIMC
jgi:hypothetical protein